jgi:hypothetical protein
LIGSAETKKRGYVAFTGHKYGNQSYLLEIPASEGVAIKEIIGVGLDMFIRKYEELHGKVRVKKPRKGDISQIFNS